MRNLAAIEGAPSDERLARRFFDALPERARAFLDRLEAEASSEAAHQEARRTALAAARGKLADAEAQRDAFRDSAEGGAREAVARLAVLEKRARAAREHLCRFETAQAAPPNIDPAALMACVFKAGVRAWRAASAEPPAIGDGETLDAALERVRGDVAHAQARIATIASAIAPLEEVHAMIDQETARMAAVGAHLLDSLFADAGATGRGGEALEGQDPLALRPEILAHCFRDQVAEALKRAAQLRFEQFRRSGVEAIASALRPDIARKADDDLLALERQEAAILRRLDGERLATRRPGMSFQAALEIE